MAIVFQCECGKPLSVSEDLLGKRVRCPACQSVLAVPVEGSRRVAAVAARVGGVVETSPFLQKSSEGDGKRATLGVASPQFSEEMLPKTLPRIDPRKHVARQTGLHETIGWTLLVIGGPIFILFTIAMTYGIALVFWLAAALTYHRRLKLAYAQLRGSAVKVQSDQFPEIFEMVRRISKNLGLQEPPETFIVEDNLQNAFALKLGRRKFLILIDDVVWGALATGNVKALSFIIGHEVAHHALGHTGVLRSRIAAHWRPLSRLDEFSCDAVSHALFQDPTAARDALALLLIGPQLYQRLDRDALDRQAREVVSDKFSKKVEKKRRLTHPLLLRRYAAVIEPGIV